MKKIAAIVPIWMVCFLLTTLHAQPIKTQSVSVFKNGTAFFVKSGEVKPVNQTWIIEQDHIPQALFGTLWFQGGNLTSVTGAQEEVETKRKTVHVHEVMEANIGKQVRITTKDNLNYEGKILSANLTFVSLQTTSRYENILTSLISGFSFVEAPEMQTVEKKQQQRIRIGFGNTQPTQNLQMMYLEKGIGWFPNYLIELTGEKTARLTMRAEIINDAEDITNAEVNVVVGVPNFSISAGVSPLVSNRSLEEFINNLNQRNNNWRAMPYSNAMMNQSISYSFEQPSDIEETTPNVEGSEQEDLYFYTLKDVTLAKGGRAFYQIQQTDIPVEHIYEVNLPPNVEQRNYYDLPVAQEKNEVLHQIKITNPGKQPFTTGTAMVVKKTGETISPISQDQLNYTPAGGFSMVKITTAPDVKVAHKEEETGREENKLRKNRINYDLITVSGEITIKNYKSKPIAINIRRAIAGELKNSNSDWLKAKRVSMNQQVNEVTDVCWELSLKAGEEKVVKYSYQVYVTN
ncbi:MAG: hypothetical protein R3D00_26970 [Bacteroidia bacterium]